MRKLFGVVVVVVAIYFAYQWLEQSDSKPAIIDTIQQTVQNAVQETGVKLKEELDSIEQRQAVQSGLSMNNTSAQAIESDKELTTDDEQGIVQFIASQLDERSPSVTFRISGSYNTVSDQLKDWLLQAFELNEYSRYALSSYSYTISNKLLYTEVELNTTFRESKEMTEQVAAFAKKLVAEMNLSQYTKEQQVKLIHDWVVTNVQYDESLTRYTAYEAITEGLAVCQGYAMLGYMLYTEAGFDVRIVEGVAKGQEHAWNMILLNDRWYQLDLTWDDPIGQAEDQVSYRYYLVSDEELAKDHTWEGNYPTAPVSYKQTLLEAASAMSPGTAEYEELQALRKELGFHWYDEENQIDSYDQLRDMLKQAVAERQSNVQFVYSDGSRVKEDIDQALRSLNKPLSYQMSYYEFSELGDMAINLTISY